MADETLASFDALATPLNHFNDISADRRKVAAYIADGLRGDDDAGLDIEAQLDFGVRGALEGVPLAKLRRPKQTARLCPPAVLPGRARTHS